MLPTPANIAPSGRIIVRITYSPSAPVVRAGDLVPASPFPQDDLVTLYRFAILSEHATTLGYHPGDEILIDTSTLGYWTDDDFDSHVVLVQTNYGPVLGRYHRLPDRPCLELLDGSRDVLIWTPDMEIIGLVHQVCLWARWERGGTTLL